MGTNERTIIKLASLGEDGARKYIEAIRWPDGPVCPHCGSSKSGTLTGVKDKKGNSRQGLYKCYECRKQYTVTVGTVMHRSHLPLQKWLVAFFMMASGKNGVSALELQRVLGIGSYKSAWHLAHRIREAMTQEPLVSKLSGVVEADEAWIGGKFHGGKGSYNKNKEPLMAIVGRDGEIRTKKLESITSDALEAELVKNVDPEATVCTDERNAYLKPCDNFAGHETVNHRNKEYSRGDVHVNSCESYFATLKRGIHGTFHHISHKHLERYCDEFNFRWNAKDVNDGQRTADMIKGVGGKRLEYSDLIGE